MSKPITKEAIAKINSWLPNLREGDIIKHCGDRIYLANGGCWLDEVIL
jgi:hypothetical protein